MMPFVQTGPERSFVLGAGDFKATNSQILNTMSPLAYYDVPIGHLIALKGGVPWRGYIKGQLIQAIDLSGDLTYAVDFESAALTLVSSARPQPALPTNTHPDFVAYISSDGGTTWTQTTINAVDLENQTLTIAKLAGTNKIKIYYLLGDGELEIRAARPVGSNGVSAMLYNNSFRGLHEVDQSNGRSAPKFGTLPKYSLAPNYRLTIEGNTKATVVWNDEARHEIVIGAIDYPVHVTDEQTLMIAVEQTLRQGF